MRAQSSNQAALVIRHGENDVQIACVAFDEPQISGYELLQRSGFDLQIGVQGLGSLICSIDDTGCSASDCLCQCKGGGECVYWSYWHRLDENWQYSQGGASVYTVDPGAVEGWSWGPGAVNQAVPPPDISFDEICQTAATNTPTPSPTPTDTRPAIVITPQPTAALDDPPTAAAAVPISSATSVPTVAPVAAEAIPLTPTPLPRQSEEQTVPVANQTQPQETVASVATELKQSPQTGPAEGLEMTETPVSVTAPAVASAATMTPGPVAIVQRAKADAKEPAPNQIAQTVDQPPAEPTMPLTVIGAGVVPLVHADSGPPELSGQNSSDIIGSDSLSYLVFLLIVSGLGGLLLFVSLRRKLR